MPPAWLKKSIAALEQRKIVIGEYGIEDQKDALKFHNTETTDFYRKGKPYRLFGNVGSSKVVFTFSLNNLPDELVFGSVERIDLTVNHCRTSADAIIELCVNGKKIQTIKDATKGNFGQQTYKLTNMVNFNRESNSIEIVLAANSPGVYWFSDAKLEAVVNPKKK